MVLQETGHYEGQPTSPSLDNVFENDSEEAFWEVCHYDDQPTRCVVLTCAPSPPIFIAQAQTPLWISGLDTMRVNRPGTLSLLVRHRCQPVFIAQAQAHRWPMSSEM
ncbi:hypothetical protein SCLCIDRAFT_1130356 [Scleroderma citrinum Foug A]|uniref:Uncharacterized protein n=1 Tax=Scleroderma citrinum Foug A TaxID=1036808 RepID=A0A0C2ZYX5_9AGAM|nr:hypothetical protein SCLCIDRAFT_1130356 [Scleroderma citrinum Foug A]